MYSLGQGTLPNRFSETYNYHQVVSKTSKEYFPSFNQSDIEKSHIISDFMLIYFTIQKLKKLDVTTIYPLLAVSTVHPLPLANYFNCLFFTFSLRFHYLLANYFNFAFNIITAFALFLAIFLQLSILSQITCYSFS